MVVMVRYEEGKFVPQAPVDFPDGWVGSAVMEPTPGSDTSLGRQQLQALDRMAERARQHATCLPDGWMFDRGELYP